MEIYISVRNLVEFILRSGNIDNRRAAMPDNTMQEGSRIHRMIQRRMGADYHAEVSLKYRHETEQYTVVIEGRADGIIIPAEYLADDSRALPADVFAAERLITIDEIKGTYRDVMRMKEPRPIHLAQAKCYAYIYASQNSLSYIRVRMTYCNLITEKLNYFHQEYSFSELKIWFQQIMEEYRRWADFEYEWRKKRHESIRGMVFPFPYRDGQKDLVTYVYQTIYHKKKLYIEAPTGVGKTISTIFPAVKAIGEGLGEKLFYLTAKTITRTVAEEAFGLLRIQGLRFKTLTLTAKDKICFTGEADCNPVACPYANGHYDRINDAIFALLTETDSFTRDRLEEYAGRFQVCPFEMGLDMSLFADGVIGDYNYLFDPHVYLKRFFAEGSRRDYLFLIDEAHNLVERGREMYSAMLRKEDFLTLKRVVGDYDEYIARLLEKCNKELLVLKRGCESTEIDGREGMEGREGVEGMEDTEGYVTVVKGRAMEPFLAPLQRALSRLAGAMDDYLETYETSPVKNQILDFYFEVCHFQAMSELLDENYVVYTQIETDGSFFIKLFCLNPSVNLRECMVKGRSTILFSATLLPIQYYKKLLGAVSGDYDVYARSVFDPAKKGLFIAADVTTKYTRRTEAEYYNITRFIYETVKNRQGNYLIFFPSHRFLQQVYELFCEYFLLPEQMECILQEEHMNEQAREAFLSRFEADTAVGTEAVCTEAAELTLLGFCVSGGIFSEGIDLKNDRLIGAIIVGTGLPKVCPEREMLMSYFNEQGENGFEYAYKLPGMNKVLQAAGRVIRTREDIGIVILLDERFLQLSYRRLFPVEWDYYETVNVDQIAGRVEKFWNDWL